MVEFEYNLYYNENEYYYSISKPVPFDIVISEHIRSDEGHGADARSIIIAGTTKSDINYCEPLRNRGTSWYVPGAEVT